MKMSSERHAADPIRIASIARASIPEDNEVRRRKRDHAMIGIDPRNALVCGNRFAALPSCPSESPGSEPIPADERLPSRSLPSRSAEQRSEGFPEVDTPFPVGPVQRHEPNLREEEACK